MLYLCYVVVNTRSYDFNWNMENHPGKQYNHKDHMALVLAEKLETLV
jgi:hypothetical protein